MLDAEYHNTEIYFCSNGISDGMKYTKWNTQNAI